MVPGSDGHGRAGAPDLPDRAAGAVKLGSIPGGFHRSERRASSPQHHDTTRSPPMRILLLIALAAGLLWLFLRSEGNPNAAARASDGAGEMLPMEPELAHDVASGDAAAIAPGPVEATLGAATPTSNQAETTGSGAVDARPHQEPAALDPVRPSAPVVVPEGSSRNASEADLAGLLFQDLGRFEAAIAAAGADLAPGRQQLARVLAAIVRGGPAGKGDLSERLEGLSGIRADELDFVREAGRASGVDAILAAARPESPFLQAARLALAARDAERRLQSGDARGAIDRLTPATIEALDGTWQLESGTLRRWTDLLTRSARSWRWTPKSDWRGLDVTVRPGDSLISIRKRLVQEHQDLLVSTGLIARSNQLAGDRIHPGDTLRVPIDPVSMLVDLDSHWAFFLMGDRIVGGWAVGVGRQGKETQVGTYRVGDKRRDPMWFPAGKDPVPFGDPRNPLGSRWIGLEHLDGRPSHLGFHGTNEPESVGKDASEGCLRMLQADVEELFEILPAGVRVVIQA